MTGVLAFLLKIGLGGAVEAALASLDRRAEITNDREAIKAKTTAELARAAVEEARIMADLNRAKLSFPWFWVFAGAFIIPLALWWSAVILDSIPYLNRIFGAEQVANLPTPQMQEWAGTMIQWLFYVGTGVAGLRALR